MSKVQRIKKLIDKDGKAYGMVNYFNKELQNGDVAYKEFFSEIE